MFLLMGMENRLLAQETIVVGQVFNQADKSPVPDVNVYFKNTNKGTTTNDEGYFMIRYLGNEDVLVFSSVGFKRKEIKIKPGTAVGLEVLMREESTLLQEVFVVPGVNPAIAFMKRVKFMRNENDVTKRDWYQAMGRSSQVVMLNRLSRRNVNRKIYDQLMLGNVSDNDSSLAVPLYMSECDVFQRKGDRKYDNENIFSSEKENERAVKQLLDNSSFKINFYDNSVVLYGKSFVSPLSGAGSVYYDYYLTDSVYHSGRKLYNVRFRTKNPKNLAFVGDMKIDSATLALTQITAFLPNEVNINFVNNLNISQSFRNKTNHWFPDTESVTLSMTYGLMGDSVAPNPEVFIRRGLRYVSDSITAIPEGDFAGSGIDAATLDAKLSAANNTPVMKFARWLADVVFTGYIPVGKIDVGKVEQLARLTAIEGLRFNIPLRTNERLWPDFTIGGYAGYATRINQIKYSVYSQYKLPWGKRNIVGVSYTDDYRRVDYDYNDFLIRENPLQTADVDIAGTLLAFRSESSMNGRKEFAATFSTDWNTDIESSLYLRSNKIYSSIWLPLERGLTRFNDIQANSLTLSTRFSFNEKSYDDHLQRIYADNYNPVIYAIAEAGNFTAGIKTGNYARLTGIIKQTVPFALGNWNYAIEGAYIFGSVPYPLLELPAGSQTPGFKRYQFSMMKFLEYATDHYVAMHNELIMNGIVFNQIPIIKHLNMREMLSFKVMYGGLSNRHRSVLDFPVFTYPLNKPYAEVGVGINNLLNVLTIQSVWRLTDRDHYRIDRWGILSTIRISL